MSCDCDEPTHPDYPDIAPGLSVLPRQWAGFPEFRRAMLAAVSAPENAVPLADWKARETNDLGVMLVEMWAYVADVLALYDGAFAQECYLATATQRGSVRKLVDHLGYVPMPATAATVELALFAEGRRAVTVPAGAAFRSGAFGDEAPQVFEIPSAIDIHPLRNQWTVEAPRPTTVGAGGASTTSLLLDPARSAKWAVGDVVLVQPTTTTSTWLPRTVTAVETVTDSVGAKYTKITFDAALTTLTSSTPLAGIRLRRPTQKAALWTRSAPVGVPLSSDKKTYTLDGVYRGLAAGQQVLVELTYLGDTWYQWFTLTAVTESTVSMTTGSGPDGSYTGNFPVTKITIDVAADTSRGAGADADHYGHTTHHAATVIHWGFLDGGVATAMPAETLAPTDPLALGGRVATPVDDTGAARFALVDENEEAVLFDGGVDYAGAAITPDGGDTGGGTLTLPVTVYGNVVTASRGETVSGEVLGSGDAATANQSFTLKKSPLTWLASSTAPSGVASTLSVRVDGVTWSEVASFYGQAADAHVFVVREDDEGKSTVTFGDGVNGARLPTGSGNVVASYRFGAGAAVPPAGSIVSIAKGAKGLRSVRQPYTAVGGSDAESAESIRTYAPRQALTIGRAVSIKDMEAVVAAYGGVRASMVTWQWAPTRQRAAVRVWYVGDATLAPQIQARLEAVSDPTTPFEVTPVTGIPVTLSLALTVDAAHDPAVVAKAVADALWDTDTGLLPPERIGIGAPFYFSRLKAACHAVAGVEGVSVTWTRDDTGVTATAYAVTPGAGHFFDLEAGALRIDGQEYGNG